MTGHPAISVEDYEDHMPLAKVETEAGDIGFYVPSRMAAFRVQTLFTKEPDTITWINSFVNGATFIDVGANVGMYTIWAAKHNSVRVLAFEPEAQNYALLNRNILLNSLEGLVAAYCLALGSLDGFSKLNISDTRIGGSFSMLAHHASSVTEGKETLFIQGCVSARLDRFLAGSDAKKNGPVYLKIDVDGIEHEVLAGARDLITDARLLSVLVELDPRCAAHQRAFQDLLQAGLFPDIASQRRWDMGLTANFIFWR